MRIHIVPAAAHLIIRNPEHGYQPLGPDGAWVEADAYWLTHIRDGNVIQVGGPSITAPVN